jgi:hypothetical protein
VIEIDSSHPPIDAANLPTVRCMRENSPRRGGGAFSCSTASEVGQVPDWLSMLLEQLLVATAPGHIKTVEP